MEASWKRCPDGHYHYTHNLLCHEHHPVYRRLEPVTTGDMRVISGFIWSKIAQISCEDGSEQNAFAAFAITILRLLGEQAFWATEMEQIAEKIFDWFCYSELHVDTWYSYRERISLDEVIVEASMALVQGEWC